MPNSAHYSEICANVRATDEISFKLLGLVPLVSGSGIFVAFLEGKTQALALPAIDLLSLFGAVVTFGLFRWELRNIQTCNWLRERASEIEKETLSDKENGVGQFYHRPGAPLIFGLRFGKTEAEKLIYSTSVIAWLSLPWAVRSASFPTGIHWSIAVVLAFLTLVSWVETKMKEICAETEINAPAERVWALLTSFGTYPEWNPFIRRIRGEPRKGVRLEVRIHLPGMRGMTFQPIVLCAEPNRELRWQGRLWTPGLFDGEHSFTIEPIGPNRVRFVQREVFNGLLVSLLARSLETDTRRGLEGMNRALKQRAEAS